MKYINCEIKNSRAGACFRLFKYTQNTPKTLYSNGIDNMCIKS